MGSERKKAKERERKREKKKCERDISSRQSDYMIGKSLWGLYINEAFQ